MEGDAADRPKRSAVKVFQSTPSAWRETNSLAALVRTIYISIHSLRMEGDSFCNFKNIANTISIHSLRMEGDVFFLVFVKRNFLYFNPLPPHGGRPGYGVSESIRYNISIHSLRMEGDDWMDDLVDKFWDISIHSLRMEGDTSFPQAGSGRGISIHSLRMEGDMRPCASCRFPNKAVHAIET